MSSSSPRSDPAGAASLVRGGDPATVRILVVDDGAESARFIEQTLRTAFACEVDVATDGVAALEQLVRVPYALVVSGMRMARMSGPELYFWVREARPALAGHFIFVAERWEGRNLGSRLAQWVVPILEKPCTASELMAVASPHLLPEIAVAV